MSRYHEVYEGWKNDPEAFWAEAGTGIDWSKPADKIYAQVDGLDRWFVGAECNTCYNCVDRHVESGRGDQLAVIYDSPITGSKATYTYSELQAEVAALGAVLQDMGVEKGDRVIVYMPMVPEALFAMLACARIGAVHSVVFGGFAPKELATRINDSKPKAILSASCGIEPGRVIAYKPLLDEAIELAESKPSATLILKREQADAELIDGRDRDWQTAVDEAKAAGKAADCETVAATDPLYILYTSGHDRPAQRCGARQRWAHGGAQVEHAQYLWHRAGRGVLGGHLTLAGSLATPTSCMRRFCMAVRRSCLKASRSVPRIRERSGG